MKRPSKQTVAPARFHDRGRRIERYCDEVLVECPRCQDCARVSLSQSPEQIAQHIWAWRLICGCCGHSAQWTDQLKNTEGPIQPNLVTGRELVLWLQTRSRGRLLWFFNQQHLHDVLGYVSALHRGRGTDGSARPSSRSMIATLPRWVVSAKNREDVKAGLKRLSKKIPETLRMPPSVSRGSA